ncbi:MAG: hypothetical protein JOZ51_01860 [Chloroflexi bacterium]|nr:hypothetical protein [Chloroflexota bacterium]
MIDAAAQIGQQRERWVYVGLMCSAVLLLAIGMLGLWFLRQPDTRLRLGNANLLGVGLPVAVRPVSRANQQDNSSWVTNLPLYLVRPAPAEILVFVQHDPRSGCLISWQIQERRFLDPCHGSAYTITGEYVRGPSGRDLKRVPVQISRDGEIMLSSQALNADLARWSR